MLQVGRAARAHWLRNELPPLLTTNKHNHIVWWESNNSQTSQQKFTTMPPASSGRYQSRLFNFVHQQSRRWGEGLGRTFRHLQVAATLSLEALMYPFFQLIQKAVESAGKQLDGAQEQSKPQLEAYDSDFHPEIPPVADTPILRVLQIVEYLQAEDVGTRRRDMATRGRIIPYSPTSLLLHSPTLSQIQGIASQLSNRQLVLMTRDNEILDILTPKQQQILEERIITEIANYWRRWRFLAAKKETNILSEINYLLNKLSSSKTNKTLPLLPSGVTKDNIEYSYILNPERSLTFLDATFAKLESNALMPISRASSELLQVIQTQLYIFIYGQEQLPASSQTTVAVDDLKNQTPKIQALIWAALNFFFGERKSKKLEPNTFGNQASPALPITPGVKPQKLTRLPQSFHSQTLTPSSHISNSYFVDPWLSESDLFGEIQETSKPLNNQLLESSLNNNATLLPSQKLNYLLKNLIYRFKAIALPQRKLKTSSKLVQLQQSIFKFTTTRKTSTEVVTSTQTASAIGLVKNGAPTDQIEPKPDWIEIKAKLIGYEQHPLELILEWLDQVMLWIERLFINIFYFLQGFFRIQNKGRR
ncbi:hypothetical protein [Chlorogloeopsis sp. ULAP02]|uniref:hypothetical protein n=1 Tax=Chlorogloeopsis sp. ULAP02 TaxID=3107926 RepID=UPI0031348329